MRIAKSRNAGQSKRGNSNGSIRVLSRRILSQTRVLRLVQLDVARYRNPTNNDHIQIPQRRASIPVPTPSPTPSPRLSPRPILPSNIWRLLSFRLGIRVIYFGVLDLDRRLRRAEDSGVAVIFSDARSRRGFPELESAERLGPSPFPRGSGYRTNSTITTFLPPNIPQRHPRSIISNHILPPLIDLGVKVQASDRINAARTILLPHERALRPRFGASLRLDVIQRLFIRAVYHEVAMVGSGEGEDVGLGGGRGTRGTRTRFGRRCESTFELGLPSKRGEVGRR